MRQAVRCALLVVAAVLPVSGLAQLNPTVKVLARPTTSVPVECEQGLSEQPVPRLAAEDKTSVRDTSLDMKAPPSATLRGELRSAVEAAQAGSHDAFGDSLTRAKSILLGYPPGGERTTAGEIVNVLDDIKRLWDFEFATSTGAFIAEGSDIFKIVSRYPGYEAYVRRQVITDRNGLRFYPTRETRQFLAEIAAERYARLTGHPLPPRTTAQETVTETRVQQSTQTPKPPATSQHEPAPRATTHTTTTTTTPKRPKTMRPPSASTTHRAAKHPPVVREASKGPAPKPRVTAKQPPPVKPIPTPAPTPPKTAAQKAPAHKPETTKTATTASVEPPPIVPAPAPIPTTESTATSSTSTMVTETSTPTNTAMTTDTSSTATTSMTQTSTQTRSRGFVIPLILILVGVGVLVLLLRASS